MDWSAPFKFAAELLGIAREFLTRKNSKKMQDNLEARRKQEAIASGRDLIERAKKGDPKALEELRKQSS